jgi:hypothetical protein
MLNISYSFKRFFFDMTKMSMYTSRVYKTYETETTATRITIEGTMQSVWGFLLLAGFVDIQRISTGAVPACVVS